jgi:hypothetical protein
MWMRRFFGLVAERARSFWAFHAFAAIFVAERIWHDAILRVIYWIAGQFAVTPTSVVRAALENPIVTFFGSAILVLVAIFFMAWRATAKEQPRLIRVAIADEAPTSPHGRYFVTDTPGEIIGLFESRTTVQGDMLVKPYIGQWIDLRGTVNDVESSHITLREPEGAGKSVALFCYFDDEWRDRFTILQRGKAVRVVGQISIIF